MQVIQLGQAQPAVLPKVEAAAKSVRELRRVAGSVKAWCRSHREQLECYVGGPLVMAFCFGLYWLASVLEGGAL